MTATPAREPSRVDPEAALDLAARVRATVVPLARMLRQRTGGQLTATQASVLGSVIRHGPLALSALAAREQLSLPMVSKVVGVLEEASLVERSPDPHDARVSLISVSTEGRRWIERSRRLRDEWLAERLGALDDGEHELVRTAIDVLDRTVMDCS